MGTQKIEKSIRLNSPKGKVWDILTNDNYTRQWYAAFMEGAYAETDWQVGSKAIFKDGNGSGLIGKIVANEPAKLLDIEYLGMVEKGVEDYESPAANSMKGGHEIYKLSSENGHTVLSVELDMAEEYYSMMSSQWDEALKKIKHLAEN